MEKSRGDGEAEQLHKPGGKRMVHIDTDGSEDCDSSSLVNNKGTWADISSDEKRENER